MKIAFFLPGFSDRPAGGYKVVYDYASGLVERGNDVSIYHIREYPNQRATSRRLLHILTDRFRSKIRWFPLDARVKVVSSFRVPVIYASAHDVLIATGVQTASYVHSLSSASMNGVYFIQHYEDWVTNSSVVDATWQLPLLKIVIAPWLLKIGRNLGVDALLIPNAINQTEFPKGPAIVRRPLRVSALVSDRTYKRTDLIVEIFNRLHSTVPGVEFATFGTADAPSGLPRNAVHYRRPSPAQLAKIYQDSRVFLCASDTEGFGLPAAEAMASGTALVSTRNGGVESFASGVAKFADAGDIDGLYREVNQLLRDEDECTRVAEEGWQRITRVGRDEAVDHFASALADLVGAFRSQTAAKSGGDGRAVV